MWSLRGNKIRVSSTYLILPTFGPWQNQTRVEGVILVVLIVARLVHMCSSAQDLLFTNIDVGVYGDSVGFNWFASSALALNLPTFSIPKQKTNSTLSDGSNNDDIRYRNNYIFFQCFSKKSLMLTKTAFFRSKIK